MARPSVAVVGGSGFIGSRLAEKLSEVFEVRVVDNRPPAISASVGYANCDIRSMDQVTKALTGVDVVIHGAIVQIPAINEQKRLGFDVNILGTQNVCQAVDSSSTIKGMILCGTWHTVGERQLQGTLDEEFGFRPDKVEERAKLYALCKIAQESTVRMFNAMSSKVFGIVRLGTVLGVGMPEKTAANIFIDRGLRGEALTPYRSSMYRPMLYVDVRDVCSTFERFVSMVLGGEFKKTPRAADPIVNLYYPKPTTILELAEIVQRSIITDTNGAVRPRVEVVDTGEPSLFSDADRNQIKVDNSRFTSMFGGLKLRSPEESVDYIVQKRIEMNSSKSTP